MPRLSNYIYTVVLAHRIYTYSASIKHNSGIVRDRRIYGIVPALIIMYGATNQNLLIVTLAFKLHLYHSHFCLRLPLVDHVPSYRRHFSLCEYHGSIWQGLRIREPLHGCLRNTLHMFHIISCNRKGRGYSTCGLCQWLSHAPSGKVGVTPHVGCVNDCHMLRQERSGLLHMWAVSMTVTCSVRKGRGYSTCGLCQWLSHAPSGKVRVTPHVGCVNDCHMLCQERSGLLHMWAVSMTVTCSVRKGRGYSTCGLCQWLSHAPSGKVGVTPHVGCVNDCHTLSQERSGLLHMWAVSMTVTCSVRKGRGYSTCGLCQWLSHALSGKVGVTPHVGCVNDCHMLRQERSGLLHMWAVSMTVTRSIRSLWRGWRNYRNKKASWCN